MSPFSPFPHQEPDAIRRTILRSNGFPLAEAPKTRRDHDSQRELDLWLARGFTSSQGDADDLVVVAYIHAPVGEGRMRPDDPAASAARREHVRFQNVRAADLLITGGL